MAAIDRLTAIQSHLDPSWSPINKLLANGPDDIVITLATRTPLCKAFKGGLKDTLLDGILVAFLKEVVKNMKLDPSLVEDICLGNVSESNAAYFIRAASLAAGFPHTTSSYTTNRFCSSGLLAVQNIAMQIQTGAIEIGLAVGAESMTVGGDRLKRPFVDDILQGPQDAVDCMQPMGQTSENVAAQFSISREDQDKYAATSYSRAKTAQESGWFQDEITPITVRKDGKLVTLTHDEGIRSTSYEMLSKLRPAFPEFGEASTAGNSSQLTDGAAAVLLMKRSTALKLGQPIVAKYVSAVSAGVPPHIMGIGPTVAIPKLLQRLKISLDDVDVVEINEAFASMAVYCRDKLQIDEKKLNPRGGAIAIGHPLGCTGIRQIVTGLSECRRTNTRVLLTSMCVGTGQGMAGLFVTVQDRSPA